MIQDKTLDSYNENNEYYKAHFGVKFDTSAITKQPYNEGLIHRKNKQWEPCL